jgi:serine/threonine protein kinase
VTTAQGELDMNDINASLHLEGLRLSGGWTVGPRSDGDSVAGTFSVSYLARHDDGREGFVKVLDLVGVFGDLEELGIAVNDYLAERDLLLICGAARMSRVVTALDHGKVTLEGFLPLLSTVHYIIFELADSDLSGALSGSDVTDIAVRLELIRDLAVGVRQLHSRSVAHQDIKPANSLFFRGSDGDRDSSKISDLGRAFRSETSTSHSSALIPGDRSFAPLELLYGFAHPQLEVRRFSADLYQLGSLICYTFAGATMNGLVAERLNPDHHWDHFGDGYADALPYVQAAYASVIADLRETLPAPVSKEIATLIEYLCEPEPERRGHPRARTGQGSAFALERVVSDLNLAAFRAGSRPGPIT